MNSDMVKVGRSMSKRRNLCRNFAPNKFKNYYRPVTHFVQVFLVFVVIVMTINVIVMGINNILLPLTSFSLQCHHSLLTGFVQILENLENTGI